MRIALAASAALLVLGAPGAVQAQESYDATDLTLRRVVGVLQIETGGVDRITVDYHPGEGLLDPPEFEVEGDELVVTQLGRRTRTNCRSRGDRLVLAIGDVGLHPVEDYGRFVIRAPEGAHIEIAGGAVQGEIGDVSSIDLRSSSCGEMTVGDVAGDAAIAVNGSGDVRVGTVGGRLDVGVNGSGGVDIGAVSGDATVAINGSGGTTVGAVGGRLVVAVNGSGDTQVASVGGAIEAAVNGSGDLEVASIAGGEIDAAIHGSGDISVLGGEASRLQAAIHGSGDVRFGGVAGEVELAAHGSGDVYVDRVTGAVRSRAFGSGRVHVGRQ